MDLFEKSFREDHHHHHHHHRRSNSRREKSPSFSSTLLDSIYRSIDESNGTTKGGVVDEEKLIYYRETMRRRKQSDEEIMDSTVRRACIIEKWIEKKKKVSFENNNDNNNKVVVRRNSTAADSSHSDAVAVLLNSSSSSSESSCGGGFSSSESDSINRPKAMQKPRPIRTSISSSAAADERKDYVSTQKEKPNNNNNKSEGGGFVKTKSKALKIYSDLKKVKQPISPGGRLATFLNSLFTSGNARNNKAKILKPEQQPAESTCSSVSSFSRSCLSKTPSSRGKSSNNNGGAKRSVRFYPVSVIVDEDCRPCGHKNLYENEQRKATNKNYRINEEELRYHVKSESQRVEEAAKEFLKNYQKKKKKEEEEEFDQMRGICINDKEVPYHDHDDDHDDDEDDDAASYSSSDLFELDNLSDIGIERYREELPVYETTHLGTNRAIASGLIL